MKLLALYCIFMLLCIPLSCGRISEGFQPPELSDCQMSNKRDMQGSLLNSVAATKPPAMRDMGNGFMQVFVQGVPFEFIRIPNGEFTMLEGGEYADKRKTGLLGAIASGSYGGSPMNEGPPRKTTITKEFWISAKPITKSQIFGFLKCSREYLPEYVVLLMRNGQRTQAEDLVNCVSNDECGAPDSCMNAEYLAQSANEISWIGAARYCQWFSSESRYPARLPTEAEWEFASRYLDNNKDYAIDRPHPQAFGRDREWVSDYYSSSIDELDKVDPKGPSNGDYRMYRYGRLHRYLARETARLHKGDPAGFRVVIEIHSAR